MDKASVIRTIVLALALVNQVLTSYGKSPLPINSAELEQLLSLCFTIGASLWAWWKNNYLSERGKKQKEVLQQHDLYKK